MPKPGPAKAQVCQGQGPPKQGLPMPSHARDKTCHGQRLPRQRPAKAKAPQGQHHTCWSQSLPRPSPPTPSVHVYSLRFTIQSLLSQFKQSNGRPKDCPQRQPTGFRIRWDAGAAEPHTCNGSTDCMKSSSPSSDTTSDSKAMSSPMSKASADPDPKPQARS